jgi:hypothetical protein
MKNLFNNSINYRQNRPIARSTTAINQGVVNALGLQSINYRLFDFRIWHFVYYNEVPYFFDIYPN